MPKYVRNADLTIEYIIKRAFQLGATSVYQDVRESHQRQIVTTWPNGDVVAFCMMDHYVQGWNMNFSNNLTSFRRSIENQGYYQKLRKESGIKS